MRAALEQATDALRAGHAAERREAGARRARGRAAAGVDPRDLPRRFLVLLAEAARAAGDPALADAYVDEARLYLLRRYLSGVVSISAARSTHRTRAAKAERSAAGVPSAA